MDTVLQNDDNLQGGITYTFTFQLGNWITEPSVATLLADIANQAPSFISSPSGSLYHYLPGIDYYNITFNYTGDGSDVVSDVAQSLIAAFNSGSNDAFSFVQATSGSAGVNNVSIAQGGVQKATTAVGDVANQIGKGVGSGIGGASSGLFSNLGASGWVVFILVALGVLAYFSMATGIRARN
jgi:hypothetical protein